MKKSVRTWHPVTFLFLLLTVLITSVPLYYVLVNSFKQKQFIQTSPMSFPIRTFTFQNVIRVWGLLEYGQGFLNSLILLSVSCILMIVIGSLAGFAIAILDSRGFRALYLAFILVIAIPFQAIMLPEVVLLKNLRLLNNYFGTSLVFAATLLPIVIFLYVGFMQSLPRELCEAAIIDGCNIFQTYFHVYMPLLKMITGTVLILQGTTVWNNLLIPYVTISQGRMTPLVLRLYTFASTRFNTWDLMFGGTFLCAIPIILLFLFLQKSFIQGVVSGAVKG